MDGDTLVHNIVGTLYNVLLEQNHPDHDEIHKILMNLSPCTGPMFDLRTRRVDGSPL